MSANPFREPAGLGESLEEMREPLLARLRARAATTDAAWEKKNQALLTHVIRALDQDNLDPVLFDPYLRGCVNPEVLIELGRELKQVSTSCSMSGGTSSRRATHVSFPTGLAG